MTDVSRTERRPLSVRGKESLLKMGNLEMLEIVGKVSVEVYIEDLIIY